MSNVTLYTTHCPKCEVLTKKLNSVGIRYQTVCDVNEMVSRGFLSAPVLEVDGVVLDFTAAVKWINNLSSDYESCQIG